MTAPTRSRTAWPGLGFDPAPGNPAQVGRLAQQLDQVARLLGATHTRLADVASGRGAWQGQGADGFAAKVGPLPRYLDEAATSLGRARQVLATWHDLLAGLKEQALALERQAAAARERATQAEHADNQARLDPLMGYVGSGRMLPPDLYDRVVAAEKRVEATTAALHGAHESLAELRRLGAVLLDRHDDGAHQAAEGIRRADDGLAPPEPGLFEKAMAWIGDHLADIADVTGAIAAVAGVIALFPLAAPIAAPVALAAAAVTAGLDIADTAVHDQWRNPENLKKVGLDAVGLIPGARFVGGIAKSLAKGEEIGSLVRRAERAVVPPSWGPGRRRVAAGQGIHKAGTRISDIGKEREDVDDWGVSRFEEYVDEQAGRAHDTVDRVGDVAGGVERALTGDDSVARGLEEKVHGVVDAAAGTAKDAAAGAGQLADRAVDAVGKAVEDSGLGQPFTVSPEVVAGTPVPADTAGVAGGGGAGGGSGADGGGAAPVPTDGSATAECAPPPPDCGDDPAGLGERVGGVLEEGGDLIEESAPEDPEPDAGTDPARAEPSGSDRGGAGEGRSDQGRPDSGRSDPPRAEASGDRGGAGEGRSDQGRPDSGRSDQGRTETGGRSAERPHHDGPHRRRHH